GKDLVYRARLGLRRVPLAYWGMTLAHLAFAMTLLGVALTSQFSVEKDLRMSPGDTLILGDMEFRFDGVTMVHGPNYVAQQGTFIVTDGDSRLILKPEKRRYAVSGNVLTEAAIDPGFLRDVYVSLGEELDGGDWAVRLQIKPFVRWIWLGALFMALGGVIAVTDARYRRLRAREVAEGQGVLA
ncbi:MAG: cytochrome c-type biogenesis CcmF C-terminal domain-containing protein, partial [Pseudomonadales bacterium]